MVDVFFKTFSLINKKNFNKMAFKYLLFKYDEELSFLFTEA